MSLQSIHWRFALLGFLCVQAFLIAAAFAWVTVYSHILNPGHDLAFYERYARASGPYLALLLSVPAFYLAGRWIAHRVPPPDEARATAAALFGFAAFLELSVLMMTVNPEVTPWLQAVNIPIKLVSCLLGVVRSRAA